MAPKNKSMTFTINVDVVTKANAKVNDYIKDLTELRATVGDRLSATFIDDTIKSIRSAQKEMMSFMKIINNPKLGAKERFAGIEGMSASYGKIMSNIQNADKRWIKEATKGNDVLLKQLDNMLAKQKELSVAKGKHTYAKNRIAEQEEYLASTGYEGGTTIKDLQALKSQIKKKELQLAKNQEKGTMDNSELEAEIKLLQEQAKAIDKIIVQRKRLKNVINKELTELSTAAGHKTTTSDPEEIQKRYDNEIGRLTGMSEDPEQILRTEDALKSFINTIQNTGYSSQWLDDELSLAFDNSQREAQELAETGQTLKQIFAQFGIGFSAAQIVRKFMDMGKAAYNFYKSLDKALNEIYIVSNLSSRAINDLTNNFIAMAEDTGMALDDVTRAATLFFQQGLNTDEVMKMTEVTAQFAKVAGIDATNAADKLTAAVNGYCLSAEDASLVADKFNKVAAASAADIDELSTAFSKAAAQANQAGVGMDNYLAYIATMVEATREAPENIGTSLKTIMSRMQQVKMSGTTEDGETDVNQVETALKSVGVALRDTNGELRDLEDVFDELGPKWQSLDRNTQAYLGTIIAGTRQQSRFITLMQNWDRVLDLSEQSANSAGQQALMHAKAMESIESKTQQLRVAIQELISNVASSDVFKGLITALTNLIKTFNQGQTPIKLVATAILLFRKQIMNTIGSVTKWFKVQMKWVNNFKKMDKVTGNDKGIKKFIKSFSLQKDQFKKNATEIENYNKYIDDLKQKQNELKNNKPDPSDAQAYAAWQDKLQKYGDEINHIKGLQNGLKQQNAELMNSYSNLASALMVAYTVFDGMSRSSNGIAKIAGSLLKVALALGIVIIAILGVKAAIDATGLSLQTLTQSNVIGLIIMAVAALGAIVADIVDACVTTSAEVKEAVANAKDALEEFANAKTAEKGAKNLLKEYEELAGKVYRTAEEQERLNSLAQELGDSLELDVAEDKYGNLSVSIQDVEDKINALEAASAEARKKMIETELDSIEDVDNLFGNKVDEFYEEYVKGNRATLRNVMGDIDTGIETKDLQTSLENVEGLFTNLKNSIIDDTVEMRKAFGGLGDNWTLTQQIESMMSSFNNADIGADQWNGLFRIMENLQGQVDEMTYEKTFNIVEAAVQRWGEAAGLTTEELEQMTDAVMASVYGNDNIHKVMTRDEEALAKADGSYYSKRANEYDRQKKINREKSRGNWSFWNPFYQDEYESQYEYYQNMESENKKEQKKYEQFVKLGKELEELKAQNLENTDAYNKKLEKYNQLRETYNFMTEKELELARKRQEILKGMNGEERDLYNETGVFDDANQDLFNKMVEDKAFNTINGALRQGGENRGNQAFTKYLLDLIDNTDDEKLREQAQNVLEGVLDGIEISGSMGWKQVHSTLESITEDLRSINSIIQEFNEEGGITLDTFGEWAEIMDGLDIGAIFNTGEIDTYLGALDNLQLGYDEATGKITANGDAMKSLQQIQMVLTKAKIMTTKEQLKADRASLLSQIYSIEAEIAANEELIQYLKDTGDTEFELKDIQAAGNVAYTEQMQKMAVAVGDVYFDMTDASETWAKASMTNITQVGEAVKQFLAGKLGEADLKRYLTNLVGTEDFEWQYTGSAVVVENLETTEDGKYKLADIEAALTERNRKGRNTITEIYSRIKQLDEMIAFLDKMEKADLSKLGLDPKEIEKYIGQLEEIYNLLRKIEGLQNRLNHLDSFLDLTYGKAHAHYLQERINKSKELIGQQEELVKQQKYLEQTEQNAIKSSSVGDVFSFDEFGNIIIDYEKYNKLQSEAVEGEMSQKELADKLYEEYQKVHETTNDYYEDLLDSVGQAIDAQQELVDTYIDLEEAVAESIKDTYQDMLDTKLESIDKEIEALDKLREARDRANQAKQDSEELSDLQSDLKRAMMDSSGASNTKVLDYQEQIRNKLEDMGEDEYTRRLDSIQESLEEEKEQLQRNFDEYFEDWTAFHAMIKERVMGDEGAIMDVLKDTDEYKQAGEEKRREMEKEWGTQIADSVTELKAVGMSIGDVQDSIIQLQDSVIDKLDELLKNGDVIEIGTLLSRVLGEYKLSSSGDDKKDDSGNGGKGNTQDKTQVTYTYPNGYEPTIVYDKDKEKITDEEVKKEKQEMDEEKKTSLFKKGDKVKSKNRNWFWGMTDSYTYDSGSDTFKKTSGGYLGAFDDTVAEVKSKNGEYYYRMKSSDRNWWVKEKDLKAYANGGMVNFTGPAWLDGTKTAPEAVLNAAQTKAFLKLADHLDMFDTEGGAGNVIIESISFNVDSMSSVEDGEKAFDAFVNKFKEIGKQKGVSINTMRLK